MKQISIIFLLISCQVGCGQNFVFAKVFESNPTSISLKWYIPALINTEGFYIYRKEINGQWKKITTNPLLYKQYKISESEYRKDKDLLSYAEMASEEKNLKGIAFIACLLKSFKSNVFSKYLGIYYEDTAVVSGEIYQYKISQIINAREVECALSKEIEAGKFIQEQAPQNIQDSTGKRCVVFRWEAEPQRYFGVNIYRRESDSAFFKKITAEPIILSQTKNKQDGGEYNSWFYEDRDVKTKTTYYYRLVGIDFFGQATQKSKDVLIKLNDWEAPAAVDSAYTIVKGKKITYHWIKKVIEEDFVGFNIYRTNKNDSDYTKINTDLIPTETFIYKDSANNYASYLYKISCVDKDGNERFSNPNLMEVYDNEAPEKPKNIIIAADSGKLTLRWNKNTEEDLKGYLIYRTVNNNNDETFVKITPNAISENIFEDKLPFNSKNRFLYKIVAVDMTLNKSEYSEIISMRMPDIQAPSAPFLKSVSQQNNNVLIEWFANSERDLLGYEIYRQKISDSAAKFEKLNHSTLRASVENFTDSHSKSGIYSYYLVALDSSLNVSSPSNTIKIKVRTESNEKISTQLKLRCKYDEKKSMVHLRWKTETNAQIIGYILYKSNDGENSFSPITGNIPDKMFTDKNINAFAQIRYQVRAYDHRGDIIKSQTITINTKKSHGK